MNQIIADIRHIIVLKQQSMEDDLLSPAWRGRVKWTDSPLKGHCYVAAEAYYHLQGKRDGFKPQVVRIDAETTHWYLKNADGKIIDPTAGQFLKPPPYEKGRGCGFLTKKPSKRARKLMRIVRQWMRCHRYADRVRD